MDWKKVTDELPEEGRSVWLFGYGIDNLCGCEELYAVGRVDSVYGLCVDEGVQMEPTHWAYCDRPAT